MYILYSKDNCPRCVTAKQLLERKGIEYEVKMAGVDYELDSLRELGVRQLPHVVWTDDMDKDVGVTIGGLEDLIKEVYR
ncbi:hypothetical protein [Erwinia phage Pecta]|nr:hypothetical protein [Erwinia phage Pecta]